MQKTAKKHEGPKWNGKKKSSKLRWGAEIFVKRLTRKRQTFWETNLADSLLIVWGNIDKNV